MMKEESYFSELNDIKDDKSLFFQMSDLSPVAIYLTDEAGNCIYVNNVWKEIAGLTSEEAFGTGWKVVLHPDDIDDVFSQWHRIVETEGRWRFEYRLVNQKTKKITWILGQARPLYNKEGVLEGYMGVNVDITHEKMRYKEDVEDLTSELKRLYTQIEEVNELCPGCLKLYSTEEGSNEEQGVSIDL